MRVFQNVHFRGTNWINWAWYIKIWVMVKFRLVNRELSLWKKYFLYACNHKISKGFSYWNSKQNQNMFHFYDIFNGLWVKSVYWCSLWWHLPKKIDYNRKNSQSFQVRNLNQLWRINFCEFYPSNLNSEC